MIYKDKNIQLKKYQILNYHYQIKINRFQLAILVNQFIVIKKQLTNINKKNNVIEINRLNIYNKKFI